MQKSVSSTNQLRRELKEEGVFIDILDRYRKNDRSFTTHDMELMWLGTSDLCYNLSKKHYGEPQKVGMVGQWYTHTKDNDSHYCRIITVLQFVRESNPNTPIKSVLFSIHRRYAWIELIVELSVLGVSYLEGMSVTKKINSALTQHIVLGCLLERRLKNELGRTPTYKEICIEYIKRQSETVGSVNFPNVERFISQYWQYKQAKNYCQTMQLDESYYQEQDTDSILSS